MKLAVCFSGIPTNRTVTRDQYRQTIAEFQTVFPDADFFFHTWDEYREEIADLNPICTPAYNPDYNAYENWTFEELPLRRLKEEKFHHGNFPEKQSRGVHQHLAHADLLSRIPEDYDMIVRARYDTRLAVNRKQHLRLILEKSYTTGRPAGFAFEHARPRQLQKIGYGRFPDWKTIHPISRRAGQVIMYERDDIKDGRAIHGIQDFMIFHRRHLFEPEQVYEWHSQKRLISSEPGWWQCLCWKKKRSLNFHGGIALTRKINRVFLEWQNEHYNWDRKLDD